ncbi:MAG: hypothetical protein CMP47_14830 [Rickettsiales bacterium]|nr:hypothetical protein [Rickettsiales bacterium]
MINNKGFSLIELMVGITLSLILIAAAVAIYLSSKQTNTVNQASIQVQDEAQAALFMLKNDISKTGWTNDDRTDVYSLGNPIENTSSEGGGGNPDTLSISFESCDSSNARNDCRTDGSDSTDCNGQNVAPNARITNTYSVNNGALTCNGQPIISGVETFQVEYGFFNGTSYEYATYNNVTDFSRVSSIRVGLIVASDTPVPGGQAGTLKLFEQDFSFSDKRLRRAYAVSIPLLNN